MASRPLLLLLAPAGVLGLLGLVGWAAGVPWLVPSLGPTIAMQALQPQSPSARPYAVVVGHCIGLASGLLAVFLTGAAGAAPLASGVLEGSRVAAAVLGMAISVPVQRSLKALHAPADATTLLFALGSLPPHWRTVLAMLGGVVIVAALGEAVRQAALRAVSDPQ